MFTISHDAPRSSLVSICSSVSPKTQCNFELEPEHSTKVSRLQRWAEHIPKLPMKIGRQLQRTKPSTPTTAIVAIKSELNIKPKISSANEDDCQHEERFALPSPQLDAFRMPAMLDAEFTRISTGKSAVSLALQRHNTQKSIRTANCQPTLSRSTSNATISCATSFPLTPASPINTATEESSAILSPTHSQCRPVIRPAQRAQTQSWYGDASVNVRSEATDSTLTQQLRRPRPQKQQQQLQDEEEKRCSLRPRLLSPTSELFLANMANCSSLTLSSTMASATSHQLLEEVNTLPSMPAKASVQVEPSNESHKPQRKVSVGPLLRSSKARIMRALSTRSQHAALKNNAYATEALEQRSPRTSLAATLNFSPRNSMSFGLQSSMERNCSGATAVSITPSTDQELLETGLANFFKPVFELNQTRIDADERRRRQLHASALFDKLAASVNDCPTEDDRCFSSKVEPATLRLTLTPSLVRGDESVWSDELRYSSMEDDEISLMTVDSSANIINNNNNDTTPVLRKQRSNGSFNRVPLKAALSKGSLRVSWIPEEPSEENQEAVQPIEHGTLTKLTEHSTSNFEIV